MTSPSLFIVGCQRWTDVRIGIGNGIAEASIVTSTVDDADRIVAFALIVQIARCRSSARHLKRTNTFTGRDRGRTSAVKIVRANAIVRQRIAEAVIGQRIVLLSLNED